VEINDQPKWLDSLDKSAVNALTLNDKRNTEGSDLVLENPAYAKISDSELVETLESILNQYDLAPTLRKIEDDNRDKIGPRSIAKPWRERKDSLLAYFNHKDYDPGGFDVSPGRFVPQTVDNAARHLIKSSSAGLPYMRKKGLVLDEALQNLHTLEDVYPCVLYTRTQEGGKTRNIWGYPIADTIREQQVFQSYLDYEKTLEHRSALLGPEAVDRSMTMLLFSKAPDEVVECVDFSQFDASVSPLHSYRAFAQIASRFQASSHEDIYRLYRRFITIPIWSPEGEIVGPHGVSSGSNFTNTVDSEVQFAAAGSPPKCQVQGDDGVYVKARSELDGLRKGFEDSGLILNVDKSWRFETQEAVYLQRYYNPEYRSKYGGLGGVYSGFRAFNRIKYLERWTDLDAIGVNGRDFHSLRTITILENCKHHPAFRDFVILAHRFDKTGLSYSEQGLEAYSNSLMSKARAGLFNGQNLKSGLNSFETIKILRSL
jgi:hypothetical protein